MMLENEKKMFAVIERLRCSGKSRSAFSKENGISVYKLKYWEGKYSAWIASIHDEVDQGRDSFVELRVADEADAPGAREVAVSEIAAPKMEKVVAEIELPHGIRVIIYDGHDRV